MRNNPNIVLPANITLESFNIYCANPMKNKWIVLYDFLKMKLVENMIEVQKERRVVEYPNHLYFRPPMWHFNKLDSGD
jgi:hypothetical protein